MAVGLKFQPPSATEASSTRPISVPNNGSSASSAPVPASRSDPTMAPGSDRVAGSKDNAWRII